MKLDQSTKGIIAVILGSFFLGSIGVFVRFASSSIEPMTQSFARIFFSFLLITIFNLLTGRLKNETFKIKSRDLPWFLLNGLVGFSLLSAAFTLSVINTDITNTYFLLYTAPIWVVILSWVFLKEKVKLPIIISIIVSLVGLVFLFNPKNLTADLIGNIYGLLCGLFFGSYFVITGYLGKHYSSPTISFWAQTIGALGLFPLIFLFDNSLDLNHNFQEWLPVMGAGTVVFCGYVLLNYGLKKIKSSVGSIFSLFEPISAILYGIILFSETPALNTIVGALLIFTSIIYLSKQQDKV